MKKVVILTVGQGHRSIAEATQQKLLGRYEAHVIQINFREFELYLPMYQYFPFLFGIPFKISEHEKARNFLFSFIEKKYGNAIRSKLEQERPAVIISCFFLYNRLCVAYAKEHAIPSIVVTTDPRTIHPIQVAPECQSTLTFDAKAHELLHTYGLSDSQIIETGWFVREQFKPTRDKRMVRQQLKLQPNLLTFLFSAGSDGSSTILKILPLFFQLQTPVQAIFICGSNNSLYKSLKIFEKTLRYAQKKSPIRFVILRFVQNFHEYIQASDLVIGKAGPNSLFETVACHVPFFAITHISGQEDGNLDIIRESNLGVVEENPLLAIRALKEIIEHPEVLSRYKESIQKMATSNEQSGKKLLELLDRI